MSKINLFLMSLVPLAACSTPAGELESMGDSIADSSSEFRVSVGSRSATDRPQRVTIRRDAYGVPHVEARTDQAALYGVGWVSAEDRLFQMQIAALTAQGRLAEFFGDTQGELDRDREARQLGTWRQAQATADALDARTAALLEAYCDGVNAFVAENPDALHPLFATYDMEPQVWTPAHAISAWRDLAAGYSGTAMSEAGRLHTYLDYLETMDPDAAAEAIIDPHEGYPEFGVVQEDDVDPDLVDEIEAYAADFGLGNGLTGGTGTDEVDEEVHFSHAFAVGGDRTTTGESVMWGSPQLPITLPSLFMEFQVRSPSFNVRGVSVPGTPAIAIGFSENVAWSLTSGQGDQADLYLLDTDGLDEDQYRIDNRILDMQVEEEEILIAGSSSETVTYRETLWGPVVTDLVDDVEAGESYALASVAFAHPERSSVIGMLGMMEATDMDAFQLALEDWAMPAANLVAADDQGGVLYSMIGAVPLRDSAAPAGGYIAQDGGTWSSRWQDVIPHAYMPQVTDPGEGLVYSGNHRPAGDWYPLPLVTPTKPLGHTHRSWRLDQLLTGERIFTPEELHDDVVMDCVDPSRLSLVELGRHIHSQDPGALSSDARKTVLALQDWADDGGNNLTDEPFALLARNIAPAFRDNHVSDDLLDAYGEAAWGATGFHIIMNELLDDDPDYEFSEDIVDYIDSVLSTAWANAEADGGTDVTDWPAAYEELYAVYEIDYFRTWNGLELTEDSSFTSEPLECANTNTLRSQPRQAYAHFVDFSGEPMSILPLGQSEHRDENPTSQAELWESGEMKPAPLVRSEIRAITVETETITYEP